MSTHFPKGPICEVCRVTTTTRARCKNRPLTRASEIPTAATLGDRITADHSVLNLDDEPSNDHWNALIVHDVFSELSYGKQRCIRNIILFAEIPASSPKARKV